MSHSTTDRGYVGALPPGAHTIQPSGCNTTGQPSLLFKATLTGAVLRQGDRGGPASVPVYEPIHGLAFNLIAGDAAQIKLTTGSPLGGASSERVFTLTRAGVWVVAAGWGTAKAEILAKGSEDTVVGWAWTDQPPRPPTRLLLVVPVAATGVAGAPIPLGAVELATDAADLGWTWLTNPDGGAPLAVGQPQPGGGQPRRVLGARYVATVDNTATWFLEAQ